MGWTAFTMHTYKKNESRRVWFVFGIMLWAAAGVATADFKIGAVRPTVSGKTLHLAGQLELGLTGKVEEALNNGIPIEFLVYVKLYRERSLMWDESIDKWALRRQVRYHALSGQYLISGDPPLPHTREGFSSLSEALEQLGVLDGVSLTLPEPLAPTADHLIGVRVTLDIEALPAVLRPVAYTSRAWDLNSGWTSWKVKH